MKFTIRLDSDYSAADAAQKLGLHSSLVYAVINGHRSHTKGHIFRRL